MLDSNRILAETADGVFGVAGGRVILANRSAESMIGAPPGGLIGKPWSTLVPHGDEILDEAVATGVRLARVAERRPDGRLLDLELSIAVHRGDDGDRCFSVIARDLSARDRALATDQLAFERAAFLASAAHQLRAPIQPVLASLRTIDRALQAGVALPADTLPRALRQTVRLGRLVDAILRDVVDLERGRLAIEASTFDLGELVAEIVQDYRMAGPTRSWHLRRPRTEVVISSDRVRVHQVLVCLFDNAVKYSERHFPIDVEIGGSIEAAWIKVTDHGIGIPMSEQPSVFMKFYRASNTPEGSDGLGIGLYLAQGVTDRIQGTLAFTSEEGKGSTFVLTLPRELAPDARAATEADHERDARA